MADAAMIKLQAKPLATTRRYDRTTLKKTARVAKLRLGSRENPMGNA